MKVRNRSVPTGGERRTDSTGGTLVHVRHGRAQHAWTQHSRPWGQPQRSLSCARCGWAVACVAYAVSLAATRAPWVRTAGVAPGVNSNAYAMPCNDIITANRMANGRNRLRMLAAYGLGGLRPVRQATMQHATTRVDLDPWRRIRDAFPFTTKAEAM